ncbi:MAG: CzcA family heavy metal efflux pump [Planctomycetota bacterium]|jgi:CzcA family heavy metal efflux pump
MIWLLTAALRLRVLVLALAAASIVWGIQIAQQMPQDVFPEFALPRVEVQIEAPGLSAEEVEGLLTIPLENALNGTSGLNTIRSKSVLGLSSVVMLFAAGSDLLAARNLVQERVAFAATLLPTIANRPVILQPLSSTSRALKIGIWSDSLSQMDLSELAKWTIRPRLMAIQGVANIAIWGQKDQQFQVLVDPDRLRSNDVTLAEVGAAVTNATELGSGGFLDTPTQRLAIQHQAAVVTPEDLANTAVRYRDGTALLIGDIADVVIDHGPPIGDAIINDQPGLLLIVEKLPWGNTLQVTREVEHAMELLRPALKDVQFDTTVFRPATFIERSLGNLGQAMLIGCGLVALILLLFLFEWRTAAISMTAIPLSIASAVIALYFLEGTFNTMILAGLVIAVGEVVDDAVIDVENISRRLRLNRLSASPLSSFRVVLLASLEVRSAVVYASMIVVLVFVPVFFLDGLAGSFFQPLALAYVLAIMASLLVALTVTPALCLLMLPKASLRDHEGPLVRGLKRAYRAVLTKVVLRPRMVVGTLLLAFVGTGFAASRLGEELLPDFKEYDFLMHWVEKPGTSIDAMTRITTRASVELREIPGVRNFGSHIGRAQVADEVVGPNFTELWISIDEAADYDTTVAAVQEVVDGYPGLQRDLLTYLKERIKEVLTGTSASIVVRIFGPDLEGLRQHAEAVQATISDIPGIVDLHVEQQVMVPMVSVRTRPEALAMYGLTAGEVRRATVTLINGTKYGQVVDGQKTYDAMVWGVPETRTDLNSLRNLLIRTPSGAHALLSDLADLAIVPTPNAIKREGASRRIDVMCNVRGADLGGVARAIEGKLKGVPFISGYHPEMLGEAASRMESQRQLLTLSVLALIGIFLLLYTDFRSLRLTMLVCLTLPFALIGGVAGTIIGGSVLSLGSLVGFITVLGIAARNGIMLVSHYRHLQRAEGEPFGMQLVLRGAEERLTPILMTAACAGLALLPLVLGGNKPGHEIEHPMALVILGGLVTSTLLNLVLLPTLYLAYGPKTLPADEDA